MIKKDEAIAIHRMLIEKFGGSNDIRDLSLLDSALNRPLGTFDGVELYPTVIEKAASLIESIIINHPFVDGNKRTGYFLMRLSLLQYGFDIKATHDEKYDFVLKIAKGEFKLKEIINWINEYLYFN